MNEICTDNKAFQCPICGRMFLQKSNARKHLSSHKVWPNGITQTLHPSGIKKGYTCPFCPEIVETHPKLRTHLKQHTNLKSYVCIQPQCSQQFPDVNSIVNHVTQTHTNPLYRCHICLYTAQSLNDISQHYTQHDNTSSQSKTEPVKYICVICKSQFSTIEHLEYHINTVTHNYSCQNCNKVFACERSLRRHLSIHSPRQHICTTCGKGFATQSYLKTHSLTHSSEKPFVCNICLVAFNRKDRLRRHSLIHLDKKLFKCPLADILGCTKEYNRSDKLKMHLRTHSGKMKKDLNKNIVEKTAIDDEYQTLELLIISLDTNNS